MAEIPDVSITMPKMQVKVPPPPKVKMQAPKMKVPVAKAPKFEPKVDFQPSIEMPEI